jgi:CBS domain containing-hemolysin-like protein
LFFLFLFFFFFFFFSSFFSLASLGRRRGREVRRKVSQGLKMLREHSRGVVLNPPPLAWEGRG